MKEPQVKQDPKHWRLCQEEDYMYAFRDIYEQYLIDPMRALLPLYVARKENEW